MIFQFAMLNCQRVIAIIGRFFTSMILWIEMGELESNVENFCTRRWWAPLVSSNMAVKSHYFSLMLFPARNLREKFEDFAATFDDTGESSRLVSSMNQYLTSINHYILAIINRYHDTKCCFLSAGFRNFRCQMYRAKFWRLRALGANSPFFNAMVVMFGPLVVQCTAGRSGEFMELGQLGDCTCHKLRCAQKDSHRSVRWMLHHIVHCPTGWWYRTNMHKPQKKAWIAPKRHQ